MSRLGRRTLPRRILLCALSLAAMAAVGYRYKNAADAIEPSAAVSDNPIVQPAHAGKFKFLALGDSYSIGERVQPADRWPNQLANRVRKSGLDLSDPVIVAQTGWTTGDLLSALEAAKLDQHFDLVMLLIGVNNQYQGRTEAEYRTQFTELLNRSINFAGDRADHVVVLSIPDWGVTPFGHSSDPDHIAKAIDRFNAINREETNKTKAAYVDVTAASRAATTQPDLIADDGLHPSARQYSLWVDAAIDAVRTELK